MADKRKLSDTSLPLTFVLDSWFHRDTFWSARSSRTRRDGLPQHQRFQEILGSLPEASWHSCVSSVLGPDSWKSPPEIGRFWDFLRSKSLGVGRSGSWSLTLTCKRLLNSCLAGLSRSGLADHSVVPRGTGIELKFGLHATHPVLLRSNTIDLRPAQTGSLAHRFLAILQCSRIPDRSRSV